MAEAEFEHSPSWNLSSLRYATAASTIAPSDPSYLEGIKHSPHTHATCECPRLRVTVNLLGHNRHNVWDGGDEWSSPFPSFYKWGNWGPKWFSNSPKLTQWPQLESGLLPPRLGSFLQPPMDTQNVLRKSEMMTPTGVHVRHRIKAFLRTTELSWGQSWSPTTLLPVLVPSYQLFSKELRLSVVILFMNLLVCCLSPLLR